MYNIWKRAIKYNGAYEVRCIERDISTWEEAQDHAAFLRLTTGKPHVAILVGGKAEPVMQEYARWTRIRELIGDDLDDAGCEWITVGNTTCISHIGWKVTDNPEVAQLVRESNVHNYGPDKAWQFIYTGEADYYQRNPRREEVEA